MSRIYVYAVPLVFSMALAGFFVMYDGVLHYDFCEGDYCYVCVSGDDLGDSFHDVSVEDFVTEGSCDPDYAVRFDRS